MIASRQCFGNRIRVRRHIFPKELAVFRLFKYSPDNTAQNPFLDQPVNALLNRIVICNIRKILVDEYAALRGVYDPVTDLFCIAVVHTTNLLHVTNIIYDWLHQCNSCTSFLGCPHKKFLFIPAKNTLISPCCQKRPRRVVRPGHSRNPRSPQA